MKTNLAGSLADFIPEVITAAALTAFSFSIGAFSFAGTVISAALMAIGAVSIDYGKYEEGGAA